MVGFAALFFLAILVEAVTEIAKAAVPVIGGTYSWIISVICGVALTVSTGIGLLQTVGVAIAYPIVDYIVTGIIISRGANYLHDLSQLAPAKVASIRQSPK
jgi:hypothetical protein